MVNYPYRLEGSRLRASIKVYIIICIYCIIICGNLLIFDNFNVDYAVSSLAKEVANVNLALLETYVFLFFLFHSEI